MKKTSIFLVFLLVPALFLLAHGKDSWNTPADAKKVPNPQKATPESIANGQAAYSKSCATCHGPKGEGDGKTVEFLKTKPHSLADAKTLGEQKDGEIFYKITKKGDNEMPSFETKLTEKDRWDLVNYLRTLATKKGATTHH